MHIIDDYLPTIMFVSFVAILFLNVTLSVLVFGPKITHSKKGKKIAWYILALTLDMALTVIGAICLMLALLNMHIQPSLEVIMMATGGILVLITTYGIGRAEFVKK